MGQSIGLKFGISQHIPRPLIPPSGPPFTRNSADNGLSVDPVTGRIVLGNDAMGVVGTGALLSRREIGLETFDITFVDFTIANPVKMRFVSDMLQLIEDGTGSETVLKKDGITITDNVTSDVSLLSPVGLLITDAATGNTVSVIPLEILVTDGPTGSFAELQGAGALVLFDATTNNQTLFNSQTMQFMPSAGGQVIMQAISAASLLDFSPDGFTTQIQFDVSLGRGTIQTGDPGSGLAAWKWGVPVAAVSVLDATRYVEVMINGVVTKLAVIV